MMIFKSLLLVAVAWLGSAAGHGRLWVPPSRSSMWRQGFSNPINYDDTALYCGGFGHQWGTNNGKCGECGDPYDEPIGKRPNQAGGKYANGLIGATYQEGEVIEIQVDVTVNHWGFFEFRLCEQNNPKQAVSQRCLDRHVLQLADGSGTRWPLPDHSTGIKRIRVQLPEGVTCTQCVLQWKYRAGNSWGCEGSKCCTGCGEVQEHFYGCSDIAITGSQRPAGPDRPDRPDRPGRPNRPNRPHFPRLPHD